MLAEKRKTEPAATQIFQAESFHLRELVRRSEYDFDSASVRRYLPYAEVKDGVLKTAGMWRAGRLVWRPGM